MVLKGTIGCKRDPQRRQPAYKRLFALLLQSAAWVLERQHRRLFRSFGCDVDVFGNECPAFGAREMMYPDKKMH